MTPILFLEQGLNGLQFGLMLFLLAAGLTLVFGIMDMINLAHGSLYMVGAYLMASFVQATGSFWIALPLALAPRRWWARRWKSPSCARCMSATTSPRCSPPSRSS
jgi:branched-subunit amino acid ABC-type transport system permease component